MREAFSGSISGQGGLTNDGEVVVLYFWNGSSDLVTDLDYAVYGDKAEAVDKTGVSIDGPDVGILTDSYLDDTAIASQDSLSTGQPHDYGESIQRGDLIEGAETKTGGNGVDGNDETSEDLSNTWCGDLPTPNGASTCGWSGIPLTKTAPEMVYSGDLFTYTLTIANPFGFTLDTVVITDAMPSSNADFAYALDGGVLTGDVISWTVPSLASLDSVSVSFAVTATGTSGSHVVNADYAVSASNWNTPTLGSSVSTAIISLVCGDPATLISEIQGSGSASPLDGSLAIIEGVVVGDYQDTADELSGFFLQEEDADADADPIYIGRHLCP